MHLLLTDIQWLRVILAGAICLVYFSCPVHAADKDEPHHGPDGFRNLDPSEDPGFLDLLKWRWQRLWKDSPSAEDYSFLPAENNPAFLRSNTRRTTYTWIGHATALLQISGRNILTDPHFSMRASPVQWAGPKRVVAPGVKLDDLPPIHMVVISHDHYDSLDQTTISRLFHRDGGKETVFFVPLGLKPWFQDLGIERVVALDWWHQHQEKDITVTAVPVHHWSKRSIFGRNRTLWAGWAIQTPDFRFFFSGDSGYTQQFKEIGRRLGPFDLSAIPIGAYEPRWFMRYHHMSPEEAVQVHLDVFSRKSVAIHWGTFILTDEPLDEPPIRLKRAMEERGIPVDEFLVLKHGETIFLD